MNLTLRLGCEQLDCVNNVNGAVDPHTFQRHTLGGLLASARAMGWDIRPVATGTGETMAAWCPSCAQRIADQTARDVTRYMEASDHARHLAVPDPTAAVRIAHPDPLD